MFTMMWDQVLSTADQLKHWWLTLSPDPSTWVPFTWVLVAVVALILVVLIVRPRRRPAARRPELLISHGELRFTEDEQGVASALHAPEHGAFALSMTVSNLSAVPVQLLELAVRTNASPAPTTAEVPAVLPPHGAVDVSAELREAGGDEGTLELFVYVPDMPPKTFRVRARLLWEPWNARFRVLPLDQKVDALRRLPSRGGRSEPFAGSLDPRSHRRAAVDRRAFEARFPDTVLEREVRFEPRPESARPRTDDHTWPGAPTGPEERAPSNDELRRRVPTRTGDERGKTGATWPPRRTSTPEGAPTVEGRGAAEEAPADRGASERARVDRADLERRAAERKAERDAAERQVAERLEAERLRRVEAVRREAERRDSERRARERQEAERLEAERLDAERRAAEQRRAEREREARKAAEQKEKARRDAERAVSERRAAQRLEAQRVRRDGTAGRRGRSPGVRQRRRRAGRRGVRDTEAPEAGVPRRVLRSTAPRPRRSATGYRQRRYIGQPGGQHEDREGRAP
ncbi:MAG: hypothetical protein P8Y13_04730 [Deinococcales bacterium]